MRISFKKQNNVGVLSIEGSLDYSASKMFKKLFSEYMKEANHFVFDMSKVDFIDSAGLAAVVTSLKKIDKLDGDIKLAGLSNQIKMIFEITRLTQVFEIHPEIEPAVSSFSGYYNSKNRAFA